MYLTVTRELLAPYLFKKISSMFKLVCLRIFLGRNVIWKFNLPAPNGNAQFEAILP